MNLGENSIKRSKHENLAAISELELSGVGYFLVVVEINIEENVLEKTWEIWMLELFVCLERNENCLFVWKEIRIVCLFGKK